MLNSYLHENGETDGSGKYEVCGTSRRQVLQSYSPELTCLTCCVNHFSHRRRRKSIFFCRTSKKMTVLSSRGEKYFDAIHVRSSCI